MKSGKLFLMAGIMFSAIVMNANAQLSTDDDARYLDTDLSFEERAADLLDKLTLQEKVSLMQNSSPAIPRLGIPAYDWWSEALHGVARNGLATVFPQAIGMAASWNSDLVHDVFTAVSDEARAKNNIARNRGRIARYQGLTFWTPNVNIFRDPRWGRGQETYGEDPYLTSVMGVAVVSGLQGPADSKYDKLHACAKHYAVHSGPEWNRHSFNAEDISPRDLWETYLPAFKSLVQDANVKEVMCAYNRYEDEPCCGSNRLLQQILRQDWGYEGLVVSDCWAINDFYQQGHHETEPDAPHAAAKAVISGTDVECGSSYANLPAALQQGLITEEQINTSVLRLLTARMQLGEFDPDNMVSWRSIPASVIDSKEHKELALKIAQQSIVLLQNKNNVLPLKKHDGRVAVIGPNATDTAMMWGNYNGTPSSTVSLLDGLKQYIDNDELFYDRGCDYASANTLESVLGQCYVNDSTLGFVARYWNTQSPGATDLVPDVVDTMASIFHFDTGGATVFAPGVNLTNFTAEYSTLYTPLESGRIEFVFKNQGAVNLFVNGTRVRRFNSTRGENIYPMDVEAGQEYKIRVIFTSPSGTNASLDFDLGRQVPIDFNTYAMSLAGIETVIFAGGISPRLEGEEMSVNIDGFKGGDREIIELPAIQTELIRALKSLGKKIIFVNFSGSAIAMEKESEMCDAIVQAWYPGQAGGTAVAQVLFGDYNPCGKLPVTFYKSTAQLPDFLDYSMEGRTYRYMSEKPQFEFGYGLSYTTFEYGQPVLSADKIKKTPISLTVPLKNTGMMDGVHVVQVYISRPDDEQGPVRTLRAFKRVELKAGECTDVMFELDRSDFEWFDASVGTMSPLKGLYNIYVGSSSALENLQQVSVTLK
ncbi:MAG: glycoside hydrolase family 3 C-terminal domain-containing protein [Bacteroidaceae bacterium]|nr:glycoside hydrolase family 3 C-terminal domain-containing protein [Bacteroidaceae bacterium]